MLLMLTACTIGQESLPDQDAISESDVNSEPESENTPVPVEEENSEEAADESAQSDSESSGNNSTSGEVSEGEASSLAPAARDSMYSESPPMVIDPEKVYYATIKTEKGDIRVQLFADRAPVTVNNFVYLARDGYYNNTVFHRVLDGFMAQAGDPTGTGAGGPGYEFEDEIVTGLGFDRSGLLAMANRGPRTNGSQFFLTLAPTEWLTGKHTIFGEVIDGTDVLNDITLRDPGKQPSFPGDEILTILIDEQDDSILPTPSPAPPTPTPTNTPTPYAPTSMDAEGKPLASLEPTERVDVFNMPGEMIIDPEKNYSAVISTSQGDLDVTLFADEAPIAVNNFVVLSELGFYDNLPVSLVNPEIILIGSPNPEDPTDDVGYIFAAEKGLSQPLKIGSMAFLPDQRDPNMSSGSQILIAVIPPPPGVEVRFSFFGQINDDNGVIDKLSQQDTITSITISVE